MGSGYVIEHCTSAFLERKKVEAYQTYVSECFRVITENTAKMSGGSYISASFVDILNPKPVDNRTGEEIVAEIIQKAGLEVV